MKPGDRVIVARMAGMRHIGRPCTGETGTLTDIMEGQPLSPYNNTAFVEFDNGGKQRVPVKALAPLGDTP